MAGRSGPEGSPRTRLVMVTRASGVPMARSAWAPCQAGPGLRPFRAETIHRIVSATPVTLQRQAGPDGVRRQKRPPDGFLILLTPVVGLATALAGRRSLPDHLGVEPDRQRTPAPARLRHWSRTHGDTMAHCRPANSRSCRSGVRAAHDPQLPRWIQMMNPLAPHSCRKAVYIHGVARRTRRHSSRDQEGNALDRRE